MTNNIEYRWVSCSLELSWDASRYRHLLPVAAKDQGTTLCGASGLGEGVWRGSKIKPECVACIERAGELKIPLPDLSPRSEVHVPKRKDEKEEQAIVLLQRVIDMDRRDRDALPGSAVKHVKAAQTIMKKRRRA